MGNWNINKVTAAPCNLELRFSFRLEMPTLDVYCLTRLLTALYQPRAVALEMMKVGYAAAPEWAIGIANVFYKEHVPLLDTHEWRKRRYCGNVAVDVQGLELLLLARYWSLSPKMDPVQNMFPDLAVTNLPYSLLIVHILSIND